MRQPEERAHRRSVLLISRSFTRKSKTDSICMCCLHTVSATEDVGLEQAEAIHAHYCWPAPVSAPLHFPSRTRL